MSTDSKSPEVVTDSTTTVCSLVLIECRTGCTCCSYENHYRGPYRTVEDAKRRIGYFKSKESDFWPVASQYARRGHYRPETFEVEHISNERFIIDDEVFSGPIAFVDVADDGNVECNDSEKFEMDHPGY